MKNIFATLFIVLISSISLLSQDKKIYYYDNEGFASSKADAAYYKVINYTKSGKVDGKIKDFYKSGEGFSMIDGAKEINKDDDNKSIYWGKKIQYYKSGIMKSKYLYDFEGELIYKKQWYLNGNIKSFISHFPGSSSIIVFNYNKDGTVSESHMTNKDGEWDPRTFKQVDGFYYTNFTDDFSTETNLKVWEDSTLEEGRFLKGKGYKISTTHEGQYKKIIPIVDYYNNGYVYSIDVQMESGDKNTYQGLIYNYLSEDKYSCFGVNAVGSYSIFHFDNSKITYEVQNKKNDNINENRKSNKLGITRSKGALFFEINGVEVFSSKQIITEPTAFGLFSDGAKKSALFTKVYLSYIKDYMQDAQEYTINSDGAFGNGTAFMIDERGYMLTNNHVIKDARYIEVEFTWDGKLKSFPAKVVHADAEKDFAILRIISNDFKTNGPIPFSIIEGNIEVGSEVFTLGYPQALNKMGKEVKFTDGKISSLSGYKNDKLVYQTTIPVQGGNSGGAVFNSSGNIIGVLSSGIPGNENVSYAIKSSFLKEFINNFNADLVTKRQLNLSKLPLTSKIKTLSNHVALVKIW